MRFGHIEIFSADPERSLAFYRDVLGFKLTARQNGMIWIQLGELEILIRPGQPRDAATTYSESKIGIVLYTDRRDSLLEELQGHGLEIKGTVDSDKCFTFTDPDGNWFQLVDPDDH